MIMATFPTSKTIPRALRIRSPDATTAILAFGSCVVPSKLSSFPFSMSLIVANVIFYCFFEFITTSPC